MDAECSVIRNKLESTIPAEKSYSVRAAHMSRVEECERSRGKKTSEQVSRDLILNTTNANYSTALCKSLLSIR